MLLDMLRTNHETWKERLIILESRLGPPPAEAPAQESSCESLSASQSSAGEDESEEDVPLASSASQESPSQQATELTADVGDPEQSNAQQIAALFASNEVQVPAIFIPAQATHDPPLQPAEALQRVQECITTLVQASLYP